MEISNFEGDFTTRQIIAHMLSILGLDRKAARAITDATEDELQIYIELIKLAAQNRKDIKELLSFSGVA